MAETGAILQAISQEEEKPHHIEIGRASYSADSEDVFSIVHSLLTKFGPLDYLKTAMSPTSRRVKFSAQFVHGEDAQRAVEKLDRAALPFNPTARLTVMPVFSVKFKVDSHIYDAVQPRVIVEAKNWERDNVWFRANDSRDPYQRFKILELECESAVNVAAAKASLESILAGIVAKDADGVVLWHSSIETNEKLYQDM